MASVCAALQQRAAAVRRVRLTLFGRACAILAAELAANALLWLVAAVLFTRPGQDRNVLSLTLVSCRGAVLMVCSADLSAGRVDHWPAPRPRRRPHLVSAARHDATDKLLTPTRRLIDNAVRRIMAEPPAGTPPRPRRPVTVGLFFSLGCVSPCAALALF